MGGYKKHWKCGKCAVPMDLNTGICLRCRYLTEDVNGTRAAGSAPMVQDLSRVLQEAPGASLSLLPAQS
jgi:hypothetical protein